MSAMQTVASSTGVTVRSTTGLRRRPPVRGGPLPCGQRRVIRRAADVPAPMIDGFLSEMAARLSRTPEARASVGLSFTFVPSDVAVRPARYEVRRNGVVTVRREVGLPSSFTFVSDADTFDRVLRGRESAVRALLQRHIHLDGSFTRICSLLRMLPAVQQAYGATRAHMIERHSQQYVFAF